MQAQKRSVAVIGVGNLGSAIAQGLCKSQESFELLLVDRSSEKLNDIVSRFSNSRVSDIETAIAQSEIVIIAVKPDAIESVCLEIASSLPTTKKPPLFVSVASRPVIAELQNHLGQNARVARVMPSIAVAVQAGISAIYATNDENAFGAKEIFENLGAVLPVKSESEFDAVLGMTASGLGFLALVAEGLVEGGIKMGLSRQDALNCVAHTMNGAGLLLSGECLEPERLRAQVSSPGGTTIAGLKELEKAGVRGALINAIEAAVNRAREL